MKILFVANRVPFPPFRGDKLKIHNLARRLSQHHDLHLITFVQSKEEWKYIHDLQPLFNHITFLNLPKWKSLILTAKAFITGKPFQVEYFNSKKLRVHLLNNISSQNYDAIHVQHLRMAQHVPEHLKSKAVLDLPDAFSLYWKRRAERASSFWARGFANLESKRVKQYELSILPTFKKCLVCSTEDLEYLKDSVPNAAINLLPNGVDLTTFKRPDSIEPIPNRILFTGNMDYEPNVDAVEYFVHRIFPIIASKNPNAEFIIAGQRPVARVLALAAEKVKITGFIENLALEYAKANVVVAPLRFGAGTQNKVIEALALGVPVVCTEVGFKGLGIKSGEGAYCELDELSFANRVLELLENKTLCESVGKKGASYIQSNLDWDIIALKLEKYLEEVAST